MAFFFKLQSLFEFFLCPYSVDTEQVLKIKYLSQIDDSWFSLIDPIIAAQKTLSSEWIEF